MPIKKIKTKLRNGKILHGYKVSFRHPSGTISSWNTTSYKTAVKLNREMNPKGQRRKLKPWRK